MKTFHPIAAATIAVSSALLFAAPLSAETITRTQTVRTADLDLSRPSHVTRLDRRIARAAQDVCGPASTFDVVGQNETRRCRVNLERRLSPQRDRLVTAALPITIAAAR